LASSFVIHLNETPEDVYKLKSVPGAVFFKPQPFLIAANQKSQLYMPCIGLPDQYSLSALLA
jgi:hypothetical protein